MAGKRLYPVLNTPFAVFVPGGVEKHRVLALGDDWWTLPRSCFRYPVPVVRMGSGNGCVRENVARQLLDQYPDHFLCCSRLEASGGMFPL